MFVELLLISSLAACGAGAAYLYYYNNQEKKAREAKRREDEVRFRSALVHELGKKRASSFQLSSFAAKCEVPADLAVRVAEEVYAGLYRKVVADGVITPEEQARVSSLARALELDSEQVQQLERRAKEELYTRAVNGVLADGTVTGEEVAGIEMLRRRLGISRHEAYQLTGDVSRSSYLATFRRIVRDGVITAEERDELLRCKQALSLSDGQANSLIREEALTLYREQFAMAIQDGVITDEEEKNLAWLQEWAGLHDSDLAEYAARIQVVKRLAAYREGKLPSIRTRKMLEGGETCHWDGPCTLIYETRTRSMSVTGDLTVTSKNVYFVAPSKSLSFNPCKILDIIRFSNGLEVKVSSRQGSGRYLVQEAEELEAILTGVVRKHKFLLSESYSSTKTRHIPDEVKREVWDRDGGRCCRCGASEYLEFDHIIPHARGGSNTAKNVQILCRKCNLMKSDRI